MSKFYDLPFVEFYDAFFMQGSNLGNKINAAQRNAKVVYDEERGLVWVHFKGKLSFVPLQSIKSADMKDIPEDLQKYWAMTTQEAEPTLPPSIRRGRKPKEEITEEFDPTDDAAAHRARVRAASANANKAEPRPVINSDDLIKTTRAAAMGVKLNKSSQVANAQQVGELASVTGKPKAMTHAQLQAQIASEAKE